MQPAVREPPLCQIAMSVTDLRRTHAWYRDGLGFAPGGGTSLFAGPLASAVQGLPGAASTCWWLVDRQDFFQLELFEFRNPPVRPIPVDWRPCDIGYTTLGVHVADLDAALEKVADAGSGAVAGPIGERGARRACVRDPEGVLVELMEDDPRITVLRDRPRAELAPVARSVTLSVADLARSRRFFVDVLGLGEVEELALHRPEHEALWGLEGAKRSAAVLSAGDFVVELVEYSEPAGRGWPSGYRISDQGLLNIAFGFRSRAELRGAYERCTAAGHEGNSRPLTFGAWSVVYVNDDQGFSVELLHAARWFDALLGFKPRRAPRFAPFLGRRRRSPPMEPTRD